MANNDGGSSFALGLLVGGILGAVVGILIAPRPGSETRGELAERSELWRTRAEELAATLRDRVGPAVETARERVSPAVETVRERVGPVVEQVSAHLGRSPEHTEVDGGSEDATVSAEDATEEKA